MMKKETVLSLLLAGFLLTGVHQEGICANTPPVQPAPLFLAGEVPPLVMLVMERDHKLYTEAYNDASDLNDDGVLDIGYNPAIDYYGYFDSYKCYDYSSANSRFEPVATTSNKKCSGHWSGDFLNYLTMSRMDCLRKVLYGGYRSTDTATETVLQRVYIPQDAHSWGKEYESIARDGFDIREYTPLQLPSSGTRHLFASTTLSDNGNPLLRVLDNSGYRIWEWVSIERPNAGTKCLDGSSGPNCAHAGTTSWEIVPQSAYQNLTRATYNTTGYTSFPANHADFETLINNYGTVTKRFGTGSVGYINGTGNPFSSQQDYYLTIFQGQIVMPSTGTWSFAIDGDDALELIIDGTVVAGWYGGHGKCSCQTHSGSIALTAGTHNITFRHQECTGDDNYYLYWQKTIPASAMTDYVVRVKVGVASMPESNCKKYPSGVYKPTGLLQRYGESDRMYFGLITGSYAKNESGGVLRKNIGSIKDEIDSNTGSFTSVNGIISTINKLRIVGYNYGDYSYNQNCGWISTRPLNEGECRMWGNPIGEMMYEALRYFAGKAAATSSFDYSGTTDDSTLGLPKATWKDPYNATTGFSYCAKPFMLVLSDVIPSYDSDKVPGTAFGSYSGDVTGLNAATLANTISTEEGVSGSFYIGQSGSTYNGACTPKSVTGLGSVRGQCPEEPTKQGSFYSAAVAYFGHTQDVNPTAQGAQKITTFAVALSSSLPRIEIPIGDKKVTLVPFAKSVGGCLGIDGTQGAFQPTDQIVDFYVEALTPGYGRFRINFEDQEQGADYDMDAIAFYEYQVVGNTVMVTVDSSQYAAGCIIQHMGYIISGTTADGTYLVVRDMDTAAGSDVNYYLDTPQHAGAALPLTSTTIFTVGSTSGVSLLQNPLWYAAKWGGFEDINKNNIPDDPKEWDTDIDGVPDNYFYVQNPLRLDEQLNKAFSAILQKAAAGSAVSVLATAGEGEGTLIQAYFKPKVTDETGLHDITWAGYLQCLWVDAYGNIREDTNNDFSLNPTEDRIIEFFQDPDTGDTRVKRYAVDSNNPYQKSGDPEYVPLDQIQPIWEAGNKLWKRSPEERTIFTYTGIGREFTSFTTDKAQLLKPYLDVTDDTAYKSLGATQTDRVSNIINFIRGVNDTTSAYTGTPTLRKKDFTIGAETHPWKLGDIVYSTPVTISKPVEQYGILYDDKSYQEFYNFHTVTNPRETVVYVGANDSMLHAFSAGKYNSAEKKFTPGATAGIGEELWAYIPRNLLPHLKWLALPSYGHLSYVDLKPKVVDAKIFTPDATHINGWGTVLIGGMNMGGYPIAVTGAFNGTATETRTFSSSFFALDVTDPSQPKFLWEQSFPGLGFTISIPAVIKVVKRASTGAVADEKWLCIIGSGPTDYAGTSSQPGRVYIVDLFSGELYTPAMFPGWFQTPENNAFMNSPVSLDKSLNYSVDALYIGTSYLDTDGSRKGKVYKIGINIENQPYTEGTDASYSLDPNTWTWTSLFNAPAPFSAPFALSVDTRDNVWVYTGTGEFSFPEDKNPNSLVAAQQNYLFGIKDPFYNSSYDENSSVKKCYHKYGDNALCKLTMDNLLASDAYKVRADGKVEVSAGGEITFDELIEKAQTKDGWYKLLAPGTLSERMINKPAVFGGIALFPAFTPDTDVCVSSGSSTLYALYFETGTAYKKSVLVNPALNQKTYIAEKMELGAGLASSFGIHTGKQVGGTLYGQQSTGVIVEVPVIPAVSVKSGTVYWREGWDRK
ncbi:MAG: PilC/PilY family type IV pilus protein [Proteobacteria bacterium]|nr:PilC/PilY family type IV pilus protein [Pseudomonadota bacterium]